MKPISVISYSNRIFVPGCLFGTLFLSGCSTTSLVKFPTNSEMIYTASMDAGTKIAKNNPATFEKYTISLHNLDRASAAQSPAGNIVRDALVESLYAPSRGLLERESSAFAAAARESGKLEARGEAAYVNGKAFDTFTDTISVLGKGAMLPAELILAYRITDAGITYERNPNSASTLTRQAKADLFYELITVGNGQVIGAGRVFGKASDKIKASERPKLESPERQASPYPFEQKRSAPGSLKISQLPTKEAPVSNVEFEIFGGIGTGWEDKTAVLTITGTPLNYGLRLRGNRWALAARGKNFTLGAQFYPYYTFEIKARSLVIDIEYALLSAGIFRGYVFGGIGNTYIYGQGTSTTNTGAGADIAISKHIRIYSEYEQLNMQDSEEAQSGITAGLTLYF